MEALQERLEGVRRRIEAACLRAGRQADDVKMVAVSKTFGPDDVREAADAGLTVFGESKVQEARHKIGMCPGHLEWHLVGHLQTNKVKEAVRFFRVIHSIDSWRLLEATNAAAQSAGVSVQALLEVNVSGEGSKFGVPPSEMPALLERCGGLPNVDILGLMTIPPFTPTPEGGRPHFRRLRDLRDQLQAATGVPLPELSMGMSGDFEVAIEEGATWIRLGSILFGDRPKKAVFRPSDDETMDGP